MLQQSIEIEIARRMARVSGMEHARKQARRLLHRFGVESVDHVRVEGFARYLNVKLFELDIDGASAQMIATEDGGCIVIPRFTDPAERRWSIAHELGHFVLKHPAPPAKELCHPRIRPRRSDRRHLEDEANAFAATLLIPERLLSEHCDMQPMTLDVPWELSELCGVPWPRCAQRLLEVSRQSCAMIVSTHRTIAHVCPSLSFLALWGGRIYSNDPLRPGSLAHRFFQTGEVCETPTLVPGSAWLTGVGPDVRLLEHTAGTSEHGGIAMTLLSQPGESVPPRPSGEPLPGWALLRDMLLGDMGGNFAPIPVAA